MTSNNSQLQNPNCNFTFPQLNKQEQIKENEIPINYLKRHQKSQNKKNSIRCLQQKRGHKENSRKLI